MLPTHVQTPWPLTDLGAWLCFQDASGQGLRPPKGRTWGRRSHTPVMSLAALIATQPGCRARLIYRICTGRRHGHGQRKGFTETDWLFRPGV